MQNMNKYYNTKTTLLHDQCFITPIMFIAVVQISILNFGSDCESCLIYMPVIFLFN